MKKRESGFTLIEIVMVLVLLGILAAVAIPKYYDLQAQAVERAADAVVAEYQSQLNGAFADGLLNGVTTAGGVVKTCTAAKGAAVASLSKVTTTKGVTDVTLGEPDGNNKISMTFKLRGVDVTGRELVAPQCK